MTREFWRCIALAALTIPGAGCSPQESRMALQPHLPAATEQLQLRGMGGGRQGGFILAGAAGTFSRSADRLGIFDPLFVSNRGGGSFRLASSTLAPELAGRCHYSEGQVNVGPISVTPGKLHYRCEFARGGRRIDAELLVADPKGVLGTLHGRAERVGTLYYEGLLLNVRSVHTIQSGGLPSPIALGYSFTKHGVEVGAIDVNGPNKTLFVPRTGPEREAVIAASLALSIFWDPEAV